MSSRPGGLQLQESQDTPRSQRKGRHIGYQSVSSSCPLFDHPTLEVNVTKVLITPTGADGGKSSGLSHSLCSGMRRD